MIYKMKYPTRDTRQPPLGKAFQILSADRVTRSDFRQIYQRIYLIRANADANDQRPIATGYQIW